jgi:hypothetical protein
MLVQTRRHISPRLPDQVTLIYGPHQTIGRFILLADSAVRKRGIYLSLEDDFDALLELNEANRAHWHPLAPTFDPRHGAVHAGNGFWICGRNERGEAVLTQVVRHFEMADTTLSVELESLRVFYPDPKRQSRPGESCDSSAEAARRISGSVVYSGGTWFRPDFRGHGLASIVPRLGRSIALSRWNIDHAFSLVQRKLVEKGIARRYGFRRVEYAVNWRNSTAGDHIEFALVSIDKDDFLFDLETTMVLH